MALTSDKDTYKQGDTPSFTIVASKDCALTLTDVDDRGEGVVLFPNKFHSDNHIKKGVAITLPGDNAGFQYRMKDKGTETVIAVCSEYGDSADGIKHDFAKAALTTVPNYTASVSRSIQVVSDCKRSIAVEASNSGSACGGVSSQQAALPAKPSTKPVTPAAPATISNAVAVPESKRASFRSAIKLTVQ